MTAPEDPFRTPDENAPASHPLGEPSAPAYGQPGTDQPQYGAQPQYGSQPQYGAAPGYGQGGDGQPRYGEPQRLVRNGLGIAALVLGILALVFCWTIFGGIIFGIIAIPLGLIGRARAKRGEASNGGMALTGVILGALGLLVSVGFIVATVAFVHSDTGKNLTDCLNKAGNDQTAQQKCTNEFRNKITN